MTREEAIKEINDDVNTMRILFNAVIGDLCNQCRHNDAEELEGIRDRLIKRLLEKNKDYEWIPVSERLPEERKKCLVTFRGGYVGIMCYASDLYGVDEYDFCDEKGKAGWYDYDRELGHYSRDDVIAWMPLPEPYKAESEVQE